MARGSAEVKDILHGLKYDSGWQEMWDRARERHMQIARDPSYQNQLVASLPDSVALRVPVPSALPEHEARLTRSILDRRYQFHVYDPTSDTDRMTVADRMELYLAHEFDANLNRGNMLRSVTHAKQAVDPVCGWWLDWNAFALPSKEKEEKDDDYEGRKRAYRERYSPFRIEVLGAGTFYALTDWQNQVTLAVREFELPWLDVARIYRGARDKRHAVQILNQHFKGMRAGYGHSVDWNEDMLRTRARVCIVDDGEYIAHYIEASGEEQGSEWKDVSDALPNPWGCPSLVLVTGLFNPEQEKAVYRYKPALDAFLQAQKNADIVNSYAASIAFSPAYYGQVLPPDIAKMLLDRNAGSELPGASFETGELTNLMGQIVKLGQEMTDFHKVIIETLHKERDSVRAPSYLTDPDPATLQETTANAYVGAVATSGKRYDEMSASEVAAIRRVVEMMGNFICGGGATGFNQGYATGKLTPEMQESLTFTITGAEPVKRYDIRKQGHKITVGPKDFEMLKRDMVLEVEIVAQTESQKQAEYVAMRTAVADGAASHRDLVAIQWEDTSSKIEEIEAERRFQEIYPEMLQLTKLQALKALVALGGPDLSPLFLQAAGMGAPQEQNGTGPQMQGVGDGLQPNVMMAPAQPVPDVRAQ